MPGTGSAEASSMTVWLCDVLEFFRGSDGFHESLRDPSFQHWVIVTCAIDQFCRGIHERIEIERNIVSEMSI